MHYGFLDESGILEKTAKEGSYFVISVVIVANPAEIKNVMKLAKRKARGRFKFHSIFHAYKESEGFIKLVLNELIKRKISIIIGTWDKRKKTKRLEKNELYRKLVAETAKITLEFFPRLNLIIHKRYTNPMLQAKINEEIIKNLHQGVLSISQFSEKERKELELADAVAYAVFQKYNRSKTALYEIIEDKIKKESRLTA